MAAPLCSLCGHFHMLHNTWGICEVIGCKPCHDELECPRCKHTFIQHTVSNKIVCCRRADCKFVACYSEQMEHRSGKPFRGRVKIENGFLVPEETEHVAKEPYIPRTYTIERRFA